MCSGWLEWMPDLIPPQSPNACCGRWFLLGEGGKPEKVPTYSCFKVLSCLTETEMEILLSWTETRTTEDTTASSLLLSGQRFHLSLSSVVPNHLQSIFICLLSDTAYQFWCFFRLGLNRNIQRTGSRCHIGGGVWARPKPQWRHKAVRHIQPVLFPSR